MVDNVTMTKIDVEILMSTFNGEKYIERQIISILEQCEVYTHILIRDDGSTDNTVALINRLSVEYPLRIRLIEGENIGFKKSFLTLLSIADEANYYGYSDQDDIWERNKVIEGIKKISEVKDQIVLYASNVRLVDEKLRLLRVSNINSMPCKLQALFTRNRMAGCTFVFTKQLFDMAKKLSTMEYKDNSMPEHDLVLASIAFACGKVIFDDNTYIYHVRHKNSVTGGGNGLIKRIGLEMNNVFVKKNIRYNLACELLDTFSNDIHYDEKVFLQEVKEYKMGIRNAMRLFTNREMKCGYLMGDIESKLKVIMRTF